MWERNSRVTWPFNLLYHACNLDFFDSNGFWIEIHGFWVLMANLWINDRICCLWRRCRFGVDEFQFTFVFQDACFTDPCTKLWLPKIRLSFEAEKFHRELYPLINTQSFRFYFSPKQTATIIILYVPRIKDKYRTGLF